MADSTQSGIPRRLAIGLASALIGGAAIPAVAFSDGGLLGGGSSSPLPKLPPITLPTPTLPITPITPKDGPVQQLVNTTVGTVNGAVGDVENVVNGPPAPPSLPTPPTDGGGGSSNNGGGSGSGGGDAHAATSSIASGSGAPTGRTDSGSGSGSTSGGGSGRGGSSHKPSGEPKHRGSGGGAAGALPGGARLIAAATTTPVNQRAGGGGNGSPDVNIDPSRGSELTRTVHDIVHVLPSWLRPLLAALALAILGLLINSLIHTRRARKLARARDDLLDEVGVLQRTLLPEVPDRIAGLAVSVAYSPAEGPAAGGDFYDVFPLRDERVGIIIGDISGHGKRALEHTSLLRYTIRAYLDAGLEPRAAIAVAGQTLMDDLGGDFATVLVAIYDSDSGTLVYSTAGHPPPLALGPGEFEPVTLCSAPPVGVDERTGLRQTTVTLPRGTDVCLYTDGVVEARKNGTMWGRDNLAAVLRGLRPQPRAGDVLTKVSEIVENSHDDMAICMLTVESKRAVPAVRIEELELEAGELDEPRLVHFLEACGVGERRIADAFSSLDTTAGEFGGAVLRVRIETGETVVTVSSPPGATTELPALQGVRLAEPIDL